MKQYPEHLFKDIGLHIRVVYLLLRKSVWDLSTDGMVVIFVPEQKSFFNARQAGLGFH